MGAGNSIYGVDEAQGGSNLRDQFTGKGFVSFSPWSDLAHTYALGQINLGYVPLSKADTYYAASIVNTSRQQFHYDSGWIYGATSYLVGQFHLTANLSSAVSSVSTATFYYYNGQLTSAAVQSVSLPSVPDQFSTKSVSNRAIKSIQNPPNSTANPTKNSPTHTPIPPQIPVISLS